MKLILPLLLLGSYSAFAGIYTRNLWNHNEIVVCFAKEEKFSRQDGPFSLRSRKWSKSNKQKMQRWITEEFTPERTGIYFTGWGDCQDHPYAEVVLFYNWNSVILTSIFGGLHGVAGELGPMVPGKIEGYPLALNSVTMSKSGMNKGAAVHEFGHVAGLAHEHNHPDAGKNGSKCIMIDPYFTTRLEYEPYDPESIMSYCSIKNKRLSDKDAELLKKLYP